MSLNYLISGNGPRLIMLHGWALNAHVWDAIRQRLAEHFTVVCVDLPGHGASEWPPEFHTLDSLAELLEPCLSVRSNADGVDGAGPCHVLGWSLGALAALGLALRRPAAIDRLVLVSPTPKFVRSTDWPHGMEERLVNDLAKRIADNYKTTVREFLALQVLGDEGGKAALRSLNDAVLAVNPPHPAALAAGLDVLRGTDLRDRLSEINVPALVMSGDRDRLSLPTAGAALAAALPNARHCPVKRCGHAPFLSHTEWFCDELMQFLLPTATPMALT